MNDVFEQIKAVLLRNGFDQPLYGEQYHEAMDKILKALLKLEQDSRKLAALEAGGVDNWEWYSDALRDHGFINKNGEVIPP